jgi:zinc/manganese transport system substrate-binding protein
MSRLSRWVPVLVGFALLPLAGCADDSGGAAADGKIAVVASTNVWGSVAQAVGGNRVSVDSLIDDDAGDPHAYPDKPEDAAAIADADLAVYNGGGYDEFFTKLVDSAGGEARRIDAFELSGKEEHAEEPAEGEEHADEEGHAHGAVNEHVWYDLSTVQKVADKIANELSAIDPDGKDTFVANAKSFGTELDTLTAKAEQIGKDNPGAKVLATEPVAHYLLEAAGLTDATPPEFSEAIEEETDPPAAVLAETTGLIADEQVAVLINNAQTETPVTNRLKDAASRAGVPVVDVTETLPQGVRDYVGWMTEQVDALAGALPTA